MLREFWETNRNLAIGLIVVVLALRDNHRVPAALVVLERGSDEKDLDHPGYERLDERRYGAATLFFLRPSPQWADFRTPLSGYYFGASGAHPGGGVMGASAAFHLAEAGVSVLLVEKNELASGSTSKAAGGVRARPAPRRCPP